MRFLILVILLHLGVTACAGNSAFPDILKKNKIYSAPFNPFHLGDSIDVSRPKHDLYFQFYNPYNFSNIKDVLEYELAYKIHLRKDKNYFKIKTRYVHRREYTDPTGLKIGHTYQYIGFSYLRRFYFKKIRWLRLELELGCVLAHNFEYYNALPYRAFEHAFGVGPTISIAPQFEIGSWGNISLLSGATYFGGFRHIKNWNIYDSSIPSTESYRFGQYLYFQYFQLGFNIYLK